MTVHVANALIGQAVTHSLHRGIYCMAGCAAGEEDPRGDVSAPNPMAVASLFIVAIRSLAIFEIGRPGQGQPHGDTPIDAFVAVLWTGLTPRWA
jgi:hypothetical protein